MNQNINIYRVDQKHWELRNTIPREKKIEKIIQLGWKKMKKSESFNIGDIPKLKKESLTYYLYVHNFAEKKSDWIKFFPYELTANLEFEVTNISILLFVDNGRDIFIIVGGRGFQLVLPYIDQTFGLSVLSRVLKPEEDFITSISSRGLTGSRSGMSEQFRDEFKIIDFIRFGKIPTKAHLTLSKKISTDFFHFLQNKQDERIKVYGGKSFKIKKNISFEELHVIITELGFILELESNDYLSPYIEVRDKNIIETQLRPLLIAAIYADLKFASTNVVNTSTIKDRKFKFDFSHPSKLAKFYEADSYLLKEKIGDKKRHQEFATLENKEDIYDAVLKRSIELGKHNDLYEFRTYIQGVRVSSYTDGKSSTTSPFLYHFTSEFNFNKQPLFLVDNRWYKLKPSFIVDLNFQCTETIKANELPSHILTLPWEKSKKESAYNLSYENQDNYIVLDTFTPDGIELCDVMYIENDQTYLIHIKHGFDASMRELTNQITLSARRLYEDKKSGSHAYLDKVYKRLKGRRSTQLDYTNDEFIKLFDKKNIIFVFAFASKINEDFLVKEHIEKYTSNIAKFSLVQCNQEMKTYSFDLKIRQIRQR